MFTISVLKKISFVSVRLCVASATWFRSPRSTMRSGFLILPVLFVLGVVGVSIDAHAKSTVEQKLKPDDLNYHQILQSLQQNRQATENLQEVVNNVMETLSSLVAEAAAAKAAKEDANTFDVNLDFTSETWHCFKECLNLFFRAMYELIVGIGSSLGKAWEQGDFMTKSLLGFMTFNTICTIQVAIQNVCWFVLKLWAGYQILRKWLGKKPKAGETDKLGDSIEAYEELTRIRRYQEEGLKDFIDRLVTKWKSLKPKISDARFLKLLKTYLPREFLQGLQDINLDEVKVEKVLKKWDNFCKWTFETTASVATRELDGWIQRMGPIKIICGDDAAQWRSRFFTRWATGRNIEIRLNPGYYHQGNAIAERAIQTLQERIRRILNGSQDQWPDAVGAAVYAMNGSWHSSIRTCPQSLALGIDRNGVVISEEHRMELWEEAIQEQVSLKKKEVARFRWKHPFVSRPFKIGDRVLLKDPIWRSRTLKKLSPRWSGPYVIRGRKSRSVWWISREIGDYQTMAHSSQLRSFYAQRGPILSE